MAANTGERTLIPALIPPGASHIHRVSSIGSVRVAATDLMVALGSLSSMMADLGVRVVPKSDILKSVIERLPLANGGAELRMAIVLRVLRLNCLTEAFSEVWAACWSDSYLGDAWTRKAGSRVPLGEVTKRWTPATPLRVASDRRQSLIEIDALVALALGITIDELCTVYRTQFPVLGGYDRDSYFFDARGRLVPTSVVSRWRKKGDAMSVTERAAEHPGSRLSYVYELPFARLDREEDLRVAYTEFENRLSNSA